MGSLKEVAPALRARRYVESVSVTYRSNDAWIGFHAPTASLNCRIESPSVTSAWRIFPVGSVNRSLSRAPKACFRKSISFAVSLTIRTGVMAWYSFRYRLHVTCHDIPPGGPGMGEAH